MIRFALFGAGRIGQVHAYNLKASDKGCLKYVIDVNERAATKLADSLGAKAVSFEVALADREVEAVIIASATNTHAELIQASSTGEMVNIDNTVGCRFAVRYSINNSAIRLTPFTSNEPS
jgi:myo-inositol 2-dehydrogenase/D-chiro-inositol 1-dehydrogenase